MLLAKTRFTCESIVMSMYSARTSGLLPISSRKRSSSLDAPVGSHARSVAITRAPDLRNPRTYSRPMPLAAPVTSTTLSASDIPREITPHDAGCARRCRARSFANARLARVERREPGLRIALAAEMAVATVRPISNAAHTLPPPRILPLETSAATRISPECSEVSPSGTQDGQNFHQRDRDCAVTTEQNWWAGTGLNGRHHDFQFCPRSR